MSYRHNPVEGHHGKKEQEIDNEGTYVVSLHGPLIPLHRARLTRRNLLMGRYEEVDDSAEVRRFGKKDFMAAHDLGQTPNRKRTVFDVLRDIVDVAGHERKRTTCATLVVAGEGEYFLAYFWGTLLKGGERRHWGGKGMGRSFSSRETTLVFI